MRTDLFYGDGLSFLIADILQIYDINLEYLGFLVEKLDNGIGGHYCDCSDYCDRHCRDMLCPEKEE